MQGRVSRGMRMRVVIEFAMRVTVVSYYDALQEVEFAPHMGVLEMLKEERALGTTARDLTSNVGRVTARS